MLFRSSKSASKSLWFRKKPSMALSKTTTLTCSSASMADMMVLNSRTNCGPIRLRGGFSNVIRQYARDVRLILICAALVTVLITTSSSRGPITRWNYTGRHEANLLDVGIALGEDPRGGRECHRKHPRPLYGRPKHAQPRDDQRRSLRCHRLNPDQLRATLMYLENRSPAILAPPEALHRKRDEGAAGERIAVSLQGHNERVPLQRRRNDDEQLSARFEDGHTGLKILSDGFELQGGQKPVLKRGLTQAAQQSAPVIERSERMIGHWIIFVVQSGGQFSIERPHRLVRPRPMAQEACETIP